MKTFLKMACAGLPRGFVGIVAWMLGLAMLAAAGCGFDNGPKPDLESAPSSGQTSSGQTASGQTAGAQFAGPPATRSQTKPTGVVGSQSSEPEDREEPPSEEQMAILAALVEALSESTDDAFRLDILSGIAEALQGKKQSPKPAGWAAAYQSLQSSETHEVRRKADELALVFQDSQAVSRLRQLARDTEVAAADRQWALGLLVDHHVGQMQQDYLDLLKDKAVRLQAIRGLGATADPQVGVRLLSQLENWDAAEQQAAIAVLASRPRTAKQLLQALKDGQALPSQVSSFHIRQIRALGDAQLNAQLDRLWGAVRDSSKDKLKQIEQWKRRLNERNLARADLGAGRKLFQAECGKCHRLHGEGGKIGPDLTGSNRDNLHYLLENVIDPSAAVANDYLLTNIQTEGGQVLSGIAQTTSNGVVRLITPDRVLLLPPEDIAFKKRQTVSMMPDGLLNKLSPDQVRDLVAFLMKK